MFAVLFMMQRRGLGVDEVRLKLATEGGLAGLSRIPGGDVRDLEASVAPEALLALQVFIGQVNEKGSADRVVSTPQSRVAVLALATNEELMVARRAYARLMSLGVSK